ncbi:type II toxin-antitoxin system VapC family toxin [Nitrospira sp. Kam-Ns4a]
MSPDQPRGLVLVDTSAWICFFAKSGYRRIKAELADLLEADLVATAGPIMLELIQGCRSDGEREGLIERLKALHWLPVEERHWIAAGKLAMTLRRNGVTVSAIDALIATLAEAYGCALLQRDRDFEQIASRTGLRLLPEPS